MAANARLLPTGELALRPLISRQRLLRRDVRGNVVVVVVALVGLVVYLTAVMVMVMMVMVKVGLLQTFAMVALAIASRNRCTGTRQTSINTP